MKKIKSLMINMSLSLLMISGLNSLARAETDLAAQNEFLKAKAINSQRANDHANHANHANHGDSSQEFHGVFYGFVPCDDCPGVKMTLSLKQNHNYLLVYQYARESSREHYEKGKYDWDEQNHRVILTPKKGGENERHYAIESDNTLIQLNSDGSKINTAEAERYELHRSDTVKSREIHFH
ncbi:MAG: hypothetical protein RL637_323 [Pseudomonadota bacterium]